ncbi:LuxR C-terminal-related transcriptional regulator [Actinoplanes sp. URMC 104]|uniref:LuxR C-terminal-related transcriptional regulator n=1 Tax=Actinoplanes sp. URMC 104 TaxID=3423409 RepID=UPI003F1E40AB
MTIRVLLCDHHQLVRAGFSQLIEAAPGMSVVGELEEPLEVADEVRRLRPDVTLLEFDRSADEVVEAVRRLPRRHDGRLLTGPIALAAHPDDEAILHAYTAGMLGFMLKTDPVENLFVAIEAVAAGRPYACPTALRCLIRHAVMHGSAVAPAESAGNELTQRERDVLQLISAGMSNAEIASALTVTEGTVKSHVSRILTKLRLQNRQQAVVYAFRRGMASGATAQTSMSD